MCSRCSSGRPKHSSLYLVRRIFCQGSKEKSVVTGGSSGIGLATAKRFVEEGAFVYIVGRRQTGLDKAASLIGGNVTAVQGDVSNLADLDRLYAKVASEKDGCIAPHSERSAVRAAPHSSSNAVLKQARAGPTRCGNADRVNTQSNML
jgi:NAD(P)-dependent dehydrogenase (short-subunit alcohol dehydrogenase family)